MVRLEQVPRLDRLDSQELLERVLHLARQERVPVLARLGCQVRLARLGRLG